LSSDSIYLLRSLLVESKEGRKVSSGERSQLHGEKLEREKDAGKRRSKQVEN
jgi:hypothetical protein